MKVVTVIPARYAASRFPGKPLALIRGKPMIQWVYERVQSAKGIDETIVATDDDRIAAVVRAFGGKPIMTDFALESGTARVAAVARQMKADVFVNVQGDEPLMTARAVECAAALVTSKRYPIGTLRTPLLTQDELFSPHVVKVIIDRAGRAAYFSRLPIPYGKKENVPSSPPYASDRHIGIYAYSRESLLEIVTKPLGAWERTEGLEQLRWLEHGIPIGIDAVSGVFIGVDTPDDLEKAERALI